MERAIQRAELLSIGSELLVGETRDTNSGDLARWLTELGVEVQRASALPDRLEMVTDAIRDAMARADLVVLTGGLGPTPDDLTREAIGAATGRTPSVDPDLERWLRDLFERRGAAFAEANLKQAWLIPSAEALPNPNGTAPGWWVVADDGAVIVALPGPPREMQPMWHDQVLPLLRARGVGADRAAETLRLTGVGESQLVGLIGEDRLRGTNPVVATYARMDAVDVRISAVGDDGHTAAELVAETVAALLPTLGHAIFAHGEETWSSAVGARLAGRTLATIEVGTGGSLATLLGELEALRFAELVRAAGAPGDAPDPTASSVDQLAEWVRWVSRADVGLAVRARERGGDTAVTVGVALPEGTHEVTRTAFQGGEFGRRRAALIAAAELWTRLGGTD
jgi:nicotinamide-nucleotide amidase